MARLLFAAVFIAGVVVGGAAPIASAVPISDDSGDAGACVGALSLSPLQYPRRTPEWIQIASSETAEIELREQTPGNWVARIVHPDRQGVFWSEILQLPSMESVEWVAMTQAPRPHRGAMQVSAPGPQMDLGKFRFRVVNDYRQKLRGIWILERSVLQRIRIVTDAH